MERTFPPSVQILSPGAPNGVEGRQVQKGQKEELLRRSLPQDVGGGWPPSQWPSNSRRTKWLLILKDETEPS